MTPPSRRKETPCKGCSAMVRNDNRSGYCARCVKTAPETRRNMSGAAHRRYADPEQRARTGAGVRRANQADPTIAGRKAAAMREIAADPEWQARNAEQCKGRRLWEKGLAAITPETRAKQGRTFSRRHGIGAWCPADYVGLARDLRRSNVPLDEVKRLVAEQEERDLARFRRGLADEGFAI